MNAKSLTVVGSGIKFLSQLTQEAIAYIRKSDYVLYLLNDPALMEWISKQNINSESLNNLYFKFEKRLDSYSAITDHIISTFQKFNHLCVVFYGHPTVYAKPALDAVVRARQQGFNAKVLPGISAEACLFADLLIDPGTVGCQSFESTDFIICSRKFDTNSHLILWQPDVIGLQDHTDKFNQGGVKILCEYLKSFYPDDHEIAIYEAAQYPGMKPIISYTSLAELPNAELSPICTLYIKPLGRSDLNVHYVQLLNLHTH